MEHHKVFETAGKKPGLQVWRVEKMDLKPVPTELQGNFFIGDSYIVLYTTPAPSYNIHSWIGNGFKSTLTYNKINSAYFSVSLRIYSHSFFEPLSVISQAKKLPKMRGGLLPSLWPNWMTHWAVPQDSLLSFKTKSQSPLWATSGPASNTRWNMIYACVEII